MSGQKTDLGGRAGDEGGGQALPHGIGHAEGQPGAADGTVGIGQLHLDFHPVQETVEGLLHLLFGSVPPAVSDSWRLSCLWAMS